MERLPFTYDEFSVWFEAYCKKYLEPARESAVRALNEHLDMELPEIERVRVKVSHGRVKGKERTWRKLELSKYEGRIKSFEDIPDVIDDLVGLRVTCNNKSDVQRVVDVVTSLDFFKAGAEPVLGRQQDSYKDYLSNPKESGYRAIHFNLCASVSAGLKRKVITCELQVRTLLQDGWGELTHEDTYKPGSAPPALVETLSRRIADLLATVDDIAQDLRQELDRLATVNIEASSEGPNSPALPLPKVQVQGEVESESGLRAAATYYLRNRVKNLGKPTDLASLAWEVRKEFGQEVSQGWFGYGSFKALLQDAVPDARVTEEPPSYVLPEDYDNSTQGKVSPYPGIPSAALALKEVDRSFPLLSSNQLNAAYERLAEASQSVDWGAATSNDISRLNEMTRKARELNSDDLVISRANLDYIAKSLLLSGNLSHALTKEEIKAVYLTWTVNRIRGVTTLGRRQLDAVKKWLS
ncbi:RelA/SpoT domain-containing protein [Streptomyces niveiscabiei]|uniref:GTP pyrophosphokinase n=1 Tax=Streptomyces niveiscabiei TaxID=164115 RepID=UPI0029B921E3|nr:RelA/SpoT domain-containing protein [Streptomyces niveiscabiei]MDX3387804.1 RelA/SpoT domain-containing protein [Streptomyces niveiscabiei]